MKTISKNTLVSKISLKIFMGDISYSDIILKYGYIVGVTCNMYFKVAEYIQKIYSIDKIVQLPSMFGKSQLYFKKEKDDVFFEDTSDYYNRITSEIMRGSNRCVLVYFKDEKELKKFYDNQQIPALIKDKIQIFYENEDFTELDNKLRKSTTLCQISLLTRKLGRGIDFVSRDVKVNTRRGIHVIQTFLSKQENEEIQIRGRTARQGQKGSFCLVFEKSKLEGKGYSNDQLYNYKSLNEKRNVLFEKKIKYQFEPLINKPNQGKYFFEFYDALLKSDEQHVKYYLSGVNLEKRSSSSKPDRILILIDVSFNIIYWKEYVSNAFHSFLKSHSRNNYPNKANLLFKLALFREFDTTAPDRLFEASDWLSDAKNISDYICKIECFGSFKMQQSYLEIGFFDALEIHKLSPISKIIIFSSNSKNLQEKSLDEMKKNRQFEKIFPSLQFSNLLTDIEVARIEINSFNFNVYPFWEESIFYQLSNKRGKYETHKINIKNDKLNNQFIVFKDDKIKPKLKDFIKSIVYNSEGK